MTFETWNYTGPFLEPFCQNGRNLIAQMFCNAFRKGKCRTPQSMVEWIADDVVRRREELRHPTSLRLSPYPEYWDSTLRAIWQEIDSEEIYDYAAFILWRESLSPEEKERLKKTTGIDYATPKMENKAPSEKQLKYLRGLRCHVIPQTMAEASRLIEEYKR